MKTNLVNEAILNNCLTGQILTVLGDESLAELKSCLLSHMAAVLLAHTATLILRLLFSWLLCSWVAGCVCAKSLQSYLTLCNPMNCSLPGSSVHGILQAKILEWVAVPSSKGSSWPRNWTRSSCGSCIAGGFLPLSHPGSPHVGGKYNKVST